MRTRTRTLSLWQAPTHTHRQEGKRNDIRTHKSCRYTRTRTHTQTHTGRRLRFDARLLARFAHGGVNEALTAIDATRREPVAGPVSTQSTPASTQSTPWEYPEYPCEYSEYPMGEYSMGVLRVPCGSTLSAHPRGTCIYNGSERQLP
jgi:hypothetical protein